MKPGDDRGEDWERRWRAPLVVLVLVLLAMIVAAIAGLVILREERAQPIEATTVTFGAAESLPLGSSAHAITVDGVRRNDIIYRPADLSGPAPPSTTLDAPSTIWAFFAQQHT